MLFYCSFLYLYLVALEGDVKIEDIVFLYSRRRSNVRNYVWICLIQICMNHIEVYESFMLVCVSVGNPLSLQQLSRITLRTVLGTRAVDVITKLDIPNRIISYLLYQ